jgi:uncharacterized membrane protein YbhN (UPF0104 family)
MRNLAKVRKIENLAIRAVILVATYLFIYSQVFHKNDLREILNTLYDDLDRPGVTGQITVLLAMMAVNWAVEAIKWRFLIRKIEKVGFFKSLSGVLSGVSVSSFTPNRVGEFFGRVYILKKASHVEGILITILGSMSQLLVTILAGSLALLVLLPRYLPAAAFSHGYIYYSILSVVLIMDVLLLVLYFNISVLNTLKDKILRSRLRRFRRFFRIFSLYRVRELAAVLLLSMLRYLIFSTQFWLMLQLFQVPVPLTEALILIPVIYFIMAVIPTVALTELGIRGSVSLYIFGLFLATLYADPAPFNPGIFSAATLLWLINLGIPALLGTLFIFRLQFFRKGE